MKKKIIIAALASILSPYNGSEAMKSLLSETTAARQGITVLHDIKDFAPLTEWPKANFFLMAEMQYYYQQIWDPRLPLGSNQKRLLETFLDEVCDFSFKVESTATPGVFIGRVDSYDKPFILSRGFNDIDVPFPKEIAHDQETLTIHINEELRNIYSCGDQAREEFKNYFAYLVQNPVGCELIRVAYARYRCVKQRITFIPTDPNANSFAVSAVSYKDLKNKSSLVMRKMDGIVFPIGAKEIFSHCIAIAPTTKQVITGDGIYPNESRLLHEMLHLLQLITPRRDTVINSRCPKRAKGTTAVKLQEIWRKCYYSVFDYEVMFGLSQYGFNSLNESAYLASRYGFMLIGHDPLSPAEKAIFMLNLDEDLYRAYLDPKYEGYIGHLLPHFGVGAYACSDLDPETELLKATEEAATVGAEKKPSTASDSEIIEQTTLEHEAEYDSETEVITEPKAKRPCPQTRKETQDNQ